MAVYINSLGATLVVVYSLERRDDEVRQKGERRWEVVG